MAEMEADDDVKISKGRSPAYPYIPLQKAVERAQKIADAGVGKNPYPPETFYKIWGLGAQSSGARQTMAALNHFGLVQYVGRGKERKVMLSDLARRIVMDKIPNSPARLQALQEAALEPPIHSDLWERYRAMLPDDIVLTTYLTLEREYNSDAAKSLISEYRDTLAYAGLDKPAEEPEDSGDDDGDKPRQFAVGDRVNWESGDQIQWQEPWLVTELQDHEDGETYLKVEGVGEYAGQSGWIPMKQAIAADADNGDQGRRTTPPPPRPPGGRRPALSEDMKEEKNSLDEGEAVLVWPKNLSAESVQDLEYWLNGILRKAKRRAGLPADKSSTAKEDDQG